MVDAQAAVALPGARLVIPERVDRAVRMHRADRIGQPVPQQAAEAGAAFRPQQRVVRRQGTGRQVVIGRADIVIAGDQERSVGLQQRLGAFGEPVEPGQLVGEARLAAGIAVGQVDADDGDAVRLDLDVARLGIVRPAGRAGSDACTVNGRRESTATPLYAFCPTASDL